MGDYGCLFGLRELTMTLAAVRICAPIDSGHRITVM